MGENPHHYRLRSARSHIHEIVLLRHEKLLTAVEPTEQCTKHDGGPNTVDVNVLNTTVNCLDLIVDEMEAISNILPKVDDFESRLIGLHVSEEAINKATRQVNKATDISGMIN